MPGTQERQGCWPFPIRKPEEKRWPSIRDLRIEVRVATDKEIVNILDKIGYPYVKGEIFEGKEPDKTDFAIRTQKFGPRRLVNLNTFFADLADRDSSGLDLLFTRQRGSQPEIPLLSEAMAYYWLAKVAQTSDFYRPQKEEMIERGHRAFVYAIATLAVFGDEKVDWRKLGIIAEEKGLDAQKFWSILQGSERSGRRSYYALRNDVLFEGAYRSYSQEKKKTPPEDAEEFKGFFQKAFERFSSNTREIFAVSPEVHQPHLEKIRELLLKYDKLPPPAINS